ncbi:hypothetical protein WJX73_002131 [Symbiochloris irregularis]|uniref:Uncharacterized protein n=1 Tax=Symbiochloris irregularis TaxID=706552 RepID=A0AAW1PWC8_9CHLO
MVASKKALAKKAKAEKKEKKEKDMARVFSVQVGVRKIALSGRQLLRAPGSLLSTMLLGDDAKSDIITLEIPSQAAAQEAAPSLLPAWPTGTEELFKVCMDCYLEGPEKQTTGCPALVPAAELLPAVRFFGIPEKLWPPGFRVAMQLLNVRNNYVEELKNLLPRCLQMMEQKLQSKYDAFTSLLNGTAAFYFYITNTGTARIEIGRETIDASGRHTHGHDAINAGGTELTLTDQAKHELTLAGQALQVSVVFLSSQDLAYTRNHADKTWHIMLLSCQLGEDA